MATDPFSRPTDERVLGHGNYFHPQTILLLNWVSVSIIDHREKEMRKGN